MTITRFVSALALAISILKTPAAIAGQEMSSSDIDLLVTGVMEEFQVPGMAVGIIKDGEIVHAKGYGVRQLGNNTPIDTNTLFSIASNSKAFTTAAISILVDDGVLGWDDKVYQYLPDFRMYDPWVSQEFTIRDLVIHNSGLGLGAGDLMFWPSPGFTREEITHKLRYLKPVSSFRSEFAYDNLLYIVAGEVIPAATGMSFEDFVDLRILKPLEMDSCAANRTKLKGEKNFADHHAVIEGKLQQVERLTPSTEETVIAAAGGLQCSVSSMLKWLRMHLNGGKLPNGESLISEKMHRELWTPQTIGTLSETARDWYGSNFLAYGLGWSISDMFGHKHVSHGGGLLGMITHVDMIPDINLGVITFTNQQSGPALRAVYTSILSSYLGVDDVDWVDRFRTSYAERQRKALQAMETETDNAETNRQPSLDLGEYVGDYRDPWFETVSIDLRGEQLYFTSHRSPRLKGAMEHFNGNTFIVRWEDRSLEADAYVKFDTDFKGTVSSMKMRAVSDLTDFSFDFHDLDFSRE